MICHCFHCSHSFFILYVFIGFLWFLICFHSTYHKYGVLVIPHILCMGFLLLEQRPRLLLLLLTRLPSFPSYSYTHTHAFVSTTSLHRCGTFAPIYRGRRGCYRGVNSRQQWWFRSRRVANVVHLAPLCIGLRGPLLCTGAAL